MFADSPRETKQQPDAERTKTPRHRVLVAEDDQEMRSLLAISLRQDGYEVVECRHGIELLDHLNQFSASVDESIDLIISDVRMPGVSGLSVLDGLSRERGAPPVILISAFGDSNTHQAASRLGAVAFFDKPFELEDLLSKVRQVVPP